MLPLQQQLNLVLSSPCFANPRVIKRVFLRLERFLQTVDAENELQKLEAGGHLGTFLTWLAGTERYRLFRHFLHAASPQEAWLLHLNLTSHDLRMMPTSVLEILEQPNFSDFYALLPLGGVSDRKPYEDERDRLFALDQLLRQRGL
jgi:hypothetical protein